MLKNGVDGGREIPPERWDVDAFYDSNPDTPGKMYLRRGYFIDDVDAFDAAFFGISPREAESMDPRQRLLLQVGWEALENAGLAAEKLKGSHAGVFMGLDEVMNEYANTGMYRIGFDPYMTTGNAIGFITGRLSHKLGLHGPSMGINTTCSSSLVAVHTACHSLAAGECDMALAGGIHLLLSPEQTIQSCKMRALSTDGFCKTFDSEADGYAIGEGCGIVVLKRLSDAQADGDDILAVIRGSAVNHDGPSAGFTVPNGSAQEELLRKALETAGAKPSDIQYVETHGTGTVLGDPIEIRALAEVMGKERENPLMLGSVKTNIGHLEEAAGIAGLIKVVLAMKHGSIPPHLHFSKPNPHISWSEISLNVSTELSPWAKDRKKLAGVSSFGMSGTNAHIILEEYEDARISEDFYFKPPCLIVLSAKKEKRLKEYAQKLVDYLEKKSDINIAEIAYTLQVGRSAMEERLALIVSDIAELKAKLSGYIQGGKDIEKLWYGNIKNGKLVKEILLSGSIGNKILTETIRRRELKTIAQLWIAGTEIDWQLIYNGKTPRRIALPTYPFARERYWIPIEDKSEVKSVGNNNLTYLHPMLHSNTSDLSKQKFTSTFTGEEFFLADHVVTEKRILPGVAYLEMARAAVEHAAGSGNHGIGIRLKNVVWARPIAVTDDPVNLHIGLYSEEDGAIAFEIYGDGEYEKDEPVVFNQGSALFNNDIEVPKLDIQNYWH
jgi:polyketide synthase PksN